MLLPGITLIQQLPSPHLLQTWEWGDFKSRYGWQPIYQTWNKSGNRPDAAALILRRALSRRLGGWPAVLYVPKGPLLNWQDPVLSAEVLERLAKIAKKQGGIFIKIDPDVPQARGLPGDPSDQPDGTGEKIVAQMKATGWRISQDQIQFRNTMEIDLALTEDELLARMKQKTRYNIRLAARHGVEVRLGSLADLPELYRMYAETSIRDGFVIRSATYYLDLWHTFIQAGRAEPLIAEVSGRPVAGLMLFYFGQRALVSLWDVE